MESEKASLPYLRQMQLRIDGRGDERSKLARYDLDTEERLHRCAAPDNLRAVWRPSVRRYADALCCQSRLPVR